MSARAHLPVLLAVLTLRPAGEGSTERDSQPDRAGEVLLRQIGDR
jgi:hypothetical protein